MENIEEIIKKLPEKWEETAKETKAFVRPREIKTAKGFMQLILMYIVHGLSLLTRQRSHSCFLAYLTCSLSKKDSTLFLVD